MTTTRVQSKTSAAAADAPVARKVHVVTFGCQMNKYDSLLVEGRFRQRGYETTADMGEADVVLFNTCSVRDHAEERTYSWLGALKREKEARPDLVIGVLGCMAQRAGEDVFGRAAQVDIVCGTRRIHHLPELVDEVRARRAEGLGPAERAARILATEMDGDVAVERAEEAYAGGRAGYLTVMRGCDLNCTYCIVPEVRGRVRSRPIDDLVREARWMIDSGAQVITLLGQTVNSYGEDFARPGAGERRGRGRGGRPSLADLIHALQELDGLERLRLITLHPAYVTDALIGALAQCDKADRFLPLPAQSGSDRILRAMKRGYTTDLYRRRTDRLRAAVAGIELGSDWIVGFPGETGADHDASERFLAEQGFAASYVFKYDPRPGTRAAGELADDVPEPVKKERHARLLARAEEAALARMRSHVGATCRVFVEDVAQRADGSSHRKALGRCIHGLPVAVRSEEDLVGRTVAVRIETATAHGLGGELAT